MAKQTLSKSFADPAARFALFRILLRDGYCIPQKFDFVNSPQRGEFPAHQDDTRGMLFVRHDTISWLAPVKIRGAFVNAPYIDTQTRVQFRGAFVNAPYGHLTHSDTIQIIRTIP